MTLTRQSKLEVTSYKFGALEFRVRGLGLYFACPKLAAKVAALTPDQLREANRAAWKQKRAAARRSERTEFMSDWDRAIVHEQVADQVCKITWKAMNGAAILNCGDVGRKLEPPAAASAMEALS